MRRSQLLAVHAALVLSLSLTAAIGCASLQATRVGRPTTLHEALSIYREADEKKAIAIAVDQGGKRTWGAFYHAELQGFANEQALAECERNVLEHRIRAECWLFAEGDEPSSDTTLACRSGKPNAKRCAYQDRFYQLLPR
jgi:hypothetical protein